MKTLRSKRINIRVRTRQGPKMFRDDHMRIQKKRSHQCSSWNTFNAIKRNIADLFILAAMCCCQTVCCWLFNAACPDDGVRLKVYHWQFPRARLWDAEGGEPDVDFGTWCISSLPPSEIRRRWCRSHSVLQSIQRLAALVHMTDRLHHFLLQPSVKRCKSSTTV